MNSAISSSPVAGTEFDSCADFEPVKARPHAGNSATSVSDSTDEQHEEAIRQASLDMQRALMRWDIFGTFDCGAEYTLAHARWLRLRGARG